jgi:hypothetical protein
VSSTPVTLHRAQRRLAAAGGRHIGDLVAWNCSSIDVPRAFAREVFQAQGFGRFVVDVDPATALSRAVHEVHRPSSLLVRPFARPKGDTPVAVGIYVQSATQGESGDEYVCGARCRIDVCSSSVVALPPDGGAAVDLALAHAQEVAEQANHLILHCETRDISAAMVSVIRELSGIPLRDRGGFYFLPPSTSNTWRHMKSGLEQLGVEPIRIEMHDALENVAVAKAAAKGALDADIASLVEDLERATTEGMRKHAIARRVDVCRELAAKAELYRGVLADMADQIAARVARLQREFERQLDLDGATFAVAVND